MADRKVLIIDDDDALIGMLQTAFKRYKFQVLLTRDGTEGLELARQEKPDLVLLSVELPVGNGFLICKEFKQDAALKDIPVVITSRKATDADFEKHRKLKVRANDYLHKPFTDEELFQKVGNVVGFSLSPDEYTELEAKVHDFLEERHKLEAEIAEKADRIAELEGALAEQESNAGAAEKQLNEQVARLGKQIGTLIDSNGKLEASIKQIEGESGVAFDELAENIRFWKEGAESVALLEETNGKLSADLQAARDKAAKAQADLATAEQQGSELGDEVEQLRGSLAGEEKKKARLREMLEKALQMLE